MSKLRPEQGRSGVSQGDVPPAKSAPAGSRGGEWGDEGGDLPHREGRRADTPAFPVVLGEQPDGRFFSPRPPRPGDFPAGGSWNVSLRRKGKARVCCLPAQRPWHCTPVGRLDLGEGPTLILYICVAPRFFFKELPGCRRHWPLSCVLAVKALELLSLGCRF